MRNLLMLLLLSLSSLSFSQEKIQMVTDLSGSFSKEIISNTASQLYGDLNFGIGVKLNCVNKGSLNISLAYQFSSNVLAYNSSGGITIDNPYIIYNSLLRSHYIGGTLKYIFREKEKKFRPFIKISALTEISTNYKNGHLLDGELIPKEDPSWYSSYTFPGYKAIYYSYLYQSTPFVGSFQVGCDIRLIKDLHLNLSAGYGLRIMKIKYVEWQGNENFHAKLNSIPIKEITSSMLDIQLGLSYAISFHKKEKPQP